MWFQHTIFIRQLYFNQFGKKSFPALKNETCTFIALTSRPFLSWSQALNSLHTIYFVRVMISLTQHRTFRVLLYFIHSSPLSVPEGQHFGPFFSVFLLITLSLFTSYFSQPSFSSCLLIHQLYWIVSWDYVLGSPQFVFCVFFSDDFGYFNASASSYLMALQVTSLVLNSALSSRCRFTHAPHSHRDSGRYPRFHMLKPNLPAPLPHYHHPGNKSGCCLLHPSYPITHLA